MSGEVARAFRFTGLPESWIVDPNGILRHRKIGAFTSSQLDFTLESVLPQARTEP